MKKEPCIICFFLLSEYIIETNPDMHDKKMKKLILMMLLCTTVTFAACSNTNDEKQTVTENETPSDDTKVENEDKPAENEEANEPEEEEPVGNTDQAVPEEEQNLNASLEELEKFMLDKGVLVGEKTEPDAKILGAEAGFQYPEVGIEVYEYDVESDIYNKLKTGESVEVEGRNYSVIASAVNGKFVLVSTNKVDNPDILDTFYEFK